MLVFMRRAYQNQAFNFLGVRVDDRPQPEQLAHVERPRHARMASGTGANRCNSRGATLSAPNEPS